MEALKGMSAGIEAVGLGKSYDGVAVLEEVAVEARPGDSVAFVSPSGSGKSTLLSMLGLLLTPSTGCVRIGGRDAGALSDKERSALRREAIGFIFQHTRLIGSLRAIENVAVPASFAGAGGSGRGAMRERARELLESFGLGDRLYHYPHQLSIGQKRRVAAARALLLAPPIVIADEPTNDLDAASAQSVADALFAHVERGGILLYATHDEALAARASRVMHLEGKTFVG